MVRVLGLSYGFHDAAAALVVDGEVVAAVEQERLTRQKHDPSFPDRAADACLAIGGVGVGAIDAVAFHEKPLGVVQRHLTSRVRSGPAGLKALLVTTPRVVRDQLTVGHQIERWFEDRGVTTPPVTYAEHHQSHAAAAFYPSPFGDAAVLTIDGVGEWATSTVGWGRGHRLEVERELRYPDSVGLLYSAFTAYCGFRVNSGEGELMGLAPFGTPRFLPQLRDEVVELLPDGSIQLNLRYFSFVGGSRTFHPRLEALLGAPARRRDEPLRLQDADVAASAQALLEEIVLGAARALHAETGRDRLCLGGGVALNCAANGRLLREGPFDEIWVQPACGDAGSAIGAALHLWHEELEAPRAPRVGDGMGGALLGPSFDAAEVDAFLAAEGIVHQVVVDEEERLRLVVELLEAGAVIGWFAGRMEFGPRALGARSILADPRSPTVQGRINAMVKERASFRPFAPAVLAERAEEWFEVSQPSPYMTFVVPVRPDRRVDAGPLDDQAAFEARVAQVRSEIPAVTHVDGSARAQTVDPAVNPRFAALLEAFDRATGCPVLLNTSFNARDEPIVCTPADAYATFVRTGLDVLVLEHCVVIASDPRSAAAPS